MPISSLNIERHTNGIVVRGRVPISAMSGIVAMASGQGFDIIDTGVGATPGFEDCLVLTSAAKQQALREELGIGPGNQDWLFSGDCGESSRTIFAILSGRSDVLPASRFSAPKDADDFGRCFRLLTRFPEWRARLPEVAARVPAFRPVVDAWDELAGAYAGGALGLVSKRLRALV